MDQERKDWNKDQQVLKHLLSPSGDHQKGIELFLVQHSRLHTAEMSGSGLWSYSDEILDGLPDSLLRQVPPGFEHSIAWLIWHMARIEDVTMNLLVAGRPQLFYEQEWFINMKYLYRETGNALDATGIATLSASVDLQALLAYRVAVGRCTRLIIEGLQPDDLHQAVSSARLERVLAEGAVVESTRSLLDYWGGRTIAGLLLMPPTRHNFIHHNEAARIRNNLKIGSPGENVPNEKPD